MKPFRHPTVLVLMFILLFATAQSQNRYDGDALAGFLNKADNDPELLDLRAHYKFDKINDTRYRSKDGIELVLKNKVLQEINLYTKSTIYGSFPGALPKKLKFGMTAGAVRELLGKPNVDYSSGYCEYSYTGYILSCWFDNGKLSQVTIAAN